MINKIVKKTIKVVMITAITRLKHLAIKMINNTNRKIKIHVQIKINNATVIKIIQIKISI
jgi:hypothetical protein